MMTPVKVMIITDERCADEDGFVVIRSKPKRAKVSDEARLVSQYRSELDGLRESHDVMGQHYVDLDGMVRALIARVEAIEMCLDCDGKGVYCDECRMVTPNGR